MTTELSDVTESVLAEFKKLPIEQQKQVSDFIEFLANKYQISESKNAKSSRVMGLFEGKGWISEDFNDPLPDGFWDNKL